uniref:L,D-TPase catalytic domain-containing protein n=1 Tax=Chlorobium chlorochromatii (strain CaD3) TaxID=340177 RepID=Q3APN4_CHLCH
MAILTRSMVLQRQASPYQFRFALIRCIAVLMLCAPISLYAAEEVQQAESAAWKRDVALRLEKYCITVFRSPGSGKTRENNLRVARFYATRSYQPLWSSTTMTQELATSLNAAFEHGLTPAEYDVAGELPRWMALTNRSAAAQARYDVLATRAFLTLATHLRYGKLDPVRFEPTWNFSSPPNLFHFDELLARTLQRTSPSEVLNGLLPRDPGYDVLKKELARYREIAKNGGWSAIPAGTLLQEGSRDARVPLLRQRLAASGDISSSAVADTTTLYNPDVTKAVKRFQQQHGLWSDGVVGATTLRAINVSADERIGQLRVNLERCRWLLHDISPTSVIVNIPAYTLHYFEQGDRRWSTRVIVGQPKRPTPVFRADMQLLILNPRWVVPSTVLAKDVLPAVIKDPAYLRKKKLRVVDENGTIIDPATIKWSSYSASTLPYRLQQKSGDDGALGRIKFLMPNRYTIYLHDTPDKALFQKTQRAFSSGCIRVQHPEELARLVLRHSNRESRPSLESRIKSGATSTIRLPQQIPVYLIYLTALPCNNKAEFREDIYHRDPQILKALDAK